MRVFKKMGFTKHAMQKGMVPWLEIYLLISKTNLETLNFVLKLRSFKKKEIHTFWNGQKLKLVSYDCMSTDTSELKGFWAAKQSSIFTGKLVKISAQGHNWNPPEIALLLATLAKFRPALPQNGKSTTWKLYFTSWRVREVVVYLYAQEKTGISYSFAKNSMSLSVSRFWEKEIWNFKIYVNLTSGRNNSNSRGRARSINLIKVTINKIVNCIKYTVLKKIEFQ